jgi:hypothetical protein
MNRERRVIIVGKSLCGENTRALVEEVLKTEKSVTVIVCSDPVPVPQKPEPVTHLLIDQRVCDDDFYFPKGRRQRKQWQRPYKYHK